MSVLWLHFCSASTALNQCALSTTTLWILYVPESVKVYREGSRRGLMKECTAFHHLPGSFLLLTSIAKASTYALFWVKNPENWVYLFPLLSLKCSPHIGHPSRIFSEETIVHWHFLRTKYARSFAWWALCSIHLVIFILVRKVYSVLYLSLISPVQLLHYCLPCWLS